MNMQAAYQTDVTDTQWELLSALLPKSKSGKGKRGRPSLNRRLVVNGILYVVKTGCQWRMLPHEFGDWNSIYHYFKKWRLDGVWHDVEAELVKRERIRQGRNPEPSAGCVDSQCVKTTTQGVNVGFNGGKLIDGRMYIGIIIELCGYIVTKT